MREASEDLKRLSAFERAKVEAGIRTYLLHNPSGISRSRIKQLRQPAPAQYRLRLGDLRVFYDIMGEVVNVSAVLSKREAVQWLHQELEDDSH